jgi:uncharacterized membrane protein YkgB
MHHLRPAGTNEESTQLSAQILGSLLLILMSFTTLSFLMTTPEVWVPALGVAAHGFPYLSGGVGSS